MLNDLAEVCKDEKTIDKIKIIEDKLVKIINGKRSISNRNNRGCIGSRGGHCGGFGNKIAKPYLEKRKKGKQKLFDMVEAMHHELKFNGGSSIPVFIKSPTNNTF